MVNVHEDAPPSSPPPLCASEDTLPSSPPSLKPKKRPPVTPRSFTRFFTPRSSLNIPNTRSRFSRHALQDISSPALNRLGPAFPKAPDDAETVPVKSTPDPLRTPSRKRKLSFCSSSSPLQSSPLRRVRIAPPIHNAVESRRKAEDHPPVVDVVPDEPSSPKENAPMPPPLRRSKAFQASSQFFLRNTSKERSTRTMIRASSGTDWQDETTNFYCQPKEIHRCWHDDHPTLPFCTTSCNTNSLVAIGDEEGGIRLVDSAKDDKEGFSKSYLSFQPHMNSIMDLEFSSDDGLLATASGDQTSLIIDMPTQTPIYCLSKHSSSVKRVQFQPASNNNVVATCSRDGSVNIWDLRYKSYNKPSLQLQCSLGPDGDDVSRRSPAKMKYAQVSNSIRGAHSDRIRSKGASEQEPQSRRDDITVTSIAFLQPGREHLFVTSSESNASVRLWDLRTAYSLRRKTSVPLAVTKQPDSHSRYRQFGLTSMTFNTDGSRLYTLCRDGTIYAYSTPHLVLGNSPEMSLSNARARRYPAEEAKVGLGPLYGFSHPRLMVGSFFVKTALRRAMSDKSELLAVGSSDNCAIVFPTDERYLNTSHSSDKENGNKSNAASPLSESKAPGMSLGRRPIGLRRTNSGTNLSERLDHTIPIYQHGTPLIEGHQKEVSAASWTNNGELITVSDDSNARCWREGPKARDLRVGGDSEGRRWQYGWADVKDPSYDEDDV